MVKSNPGHSSGDRKFHHFGRRQVEGPHVFLGNNEQFTRPVIGMGEQHGHLAFDTQIGQVFGGDETDLFEVPKPGSP